MLSAFGVLIQVALLLAWYMVPAMATVPAWVIFLPIIVGLAGLGVFVLVIILGLVTAFLAS